MKISTKGKYAVEALLYMAHFSVGRPLTVKEIGEGIKVPVRYLEQIFFQLRKSDVLVTVRGLKGGYQLSQEALNLTIGAVIKSVEGEMVPVACIKDLSQCPSNLQRFCTTRELWMTLDEAFNEVIEGLTLGQLLENYESDLQKKYGELEYYL